MTTSTRRAAARRGTPRRALLSAALAVTLAAPVALASTTAAAAPTTDPARAAAGYLADTLAAQDDPFPGQLADTILAFAATGTGGDAAAAAYAQLETIGAAGDFTPAEGFTTGIAAKVALAASALGEDLTDVGGEDLQALMIDDIGDDGQVGTAVQLFNQSLVVLALSTTVQGAPQDAVDFLVAGACADGGYTFPGTCQDPEGDNDPDATAVAAQALLAADADASAQIGWLLDNQDEATGGFASSGLLNTNSSALAAQALRAAGSEEAADAAAAYVATLFEGCDAEADVRGSYRFTADQPESRQLATAQAVFADAPALDRLDGTALSADVERLSCADTFCPSDTGVSVAVDFTTLDPGADVEVRCAFDLPEDPTGLDVLEAAGFEIETEEFSFGVALCSIEGLPAVDEGDCFGGGGFYSYWNAPQGGEWTSYGVGAGDSQPAVGTIEGFAWAEGAGVPPRVSTTPAGFAEPESPELPFNRGIANACPGEYAPRFSDVPADSIHATAIDCLGSADVIRGTGDGSTFSPSNGVTRDQVASLLLRTIEDATGDTLPVGDARFDDVAGNFHEDAILALANAGIIRGTGDGTSFSPRSTLDRGQMASLLDRSLDVVDNGALDGSFPATAAEADVFGDVPTGFVHAPAVDRLANQGVVQGRVDGTYGLNVDVRRDQLASFLARSLDLAVTEGLAQPVG